MARKGQITVQDHVETNEEYEDYLTDNFGKVICMEVYSTFCGNCLALGNTIRKIKLDIAGEYMVFVKAVADDIEALARFKGKSEPVFMFIAQGKVTQVMFGANGVKLFDIAQREIDCEIAEREGAMKPRPRFDIEQPHPDEVEKLEIEAELKAEREEEARIHKEIVQATRKKRVNLRLASNPDVKHMNFILFWPHCHQAHNDLYEKWDRQNLQMGAKETLQLTEELAKEVFYMGDVDLNEACMHSILNGPVLAVLFRMYDADRRDFISLLRYHLYEEIPEPKEDVPPEEQPPRVTAFVKYATVSKPVHQVRRERYEARMQKKREEEEERERLRQEEERLAREAEEERLRLEKQKEDEERMQRMQAGGGAKQEEEEAEGEQVEGEEAEAEQKEEPEPEQEEEPPEDIMEEEVKEEAEFSSQISVEGEEYIPPGGLFVPGLYAPPNELAKANAMAIFFPKFLCNYAKLESEWLPPHVLITFPIEKRNEVMEVVAQYPDEIIHQGVFAGENIYTLEHIAFTAKQYDRLGFRIPKPHERIALMVAHRRSVPTLALTQLGPNHVSMNLEAGVSECEALFPVGYGDDYFEEESVHEEEVVEVVEVQPEVVVEAEPEPEPAPPQEEEEEED